MHAVERRCRVKNRTSRIASWLWPVAVLLLAAGCVEEPPPPPPVPDMAPLGDGLKVIGYAVIGAAVVLTLGKLLER
jgi:hypothetical protein